MSDVSFGLLVLAFRIAVVVALYLFVVQVMRTMRAEMALTVRRTAAADQGPVLEVVAVEGMPAMSGRVFPLDPITSIGREDGNNVVIPDPRVSGRHARLVWRTDGWWLEDLGSTNGTFVNGRPIGGSAPIRAQDIVKLGPATLRVKTS